MHSEVGDMHYSTLGLCSALHTVGAYGKSLKCLIICMNIKSDEEQCFT